MSVTQHAVVLGRKLLFRFSINTKAAMESGERCKLPGEVRAQTRPYGVADLGTYAGSAHKTQTTFIKP